MPSAGGGMLQPWEALKTWWQQHTVYSLIIAGAALPGAILKYCEVPAKISAWRNKKHVGAENEPLISKVNERFGFTFLYPRNWERTSAHNADGSKIHSPSDKDIEIAAWGCYAMMPDSFDKWIEETIQKA